MVQWQLSTPEHLMHSGFGRPRPRHGLQLLFWFANHCVTCEPSNLVVVMMLVSDCQPERGFYGFHQFGNIEELLPVLRRPKKRKSGRQVAYFEVGNLNTETYPASANLPAYVRENYGLRGSRRKDNIDRIIISYQVKTRVVEMVYVTEHDTAASGRFSPDRTHEISPELIRALQSPQLELTTFLIQMGYYGDLELVRVGDMGQIHDRGPSAQQILNIVQSHNGSSARRQETDNLRFFSGAFNHHIDVNVTPYSYDQQVANYFVNLTTSDYNQLMAAYGLEQHDYQRFRANMGPRGLVEAFVSAWERWSDPGSDEEVKKWKKRGIRIVTAVLGAGAIYLAAKTFSWLRSWWKMDWNGHLRVTRFKLNTPVMLDYVY
ncbi:uncharacterized protein [Centroberyx affinis]